MSLSRLFPALIRRFFPTSAEFWKLNLFFWALYALLAWTSRAIFQGPVHALIFTAALEGSALLLSLVLHALYRHSGRDFDLRTAALVLVASLAAGLVQGAVGFAVGALTGWFDTAFEHSIHIVLRLFVAWLVFMLWSLLFYWFNAETERSQEAVLKEAAQLEAQRMELQMLRAQLDPHFLFNSLNGIAAEIGPHPAAATEMVNELSDYLRYSLEHRRQPIARLAEELGAMEAYLQIERARFGPMLSYRIDAAEAARMRLVPSFLLQPLVENAVKHGRRSRTEPLELEITAGVDGNLLTIAVSNSGHLRQSRPDAAAGIGLETLRRRLDLHYPGRHRFELQEHGGRVVATLQLWEPPCSA